MKLYHGSVVTVKNPSIRQGRSNTDFGKGFYTTIDFEQAARWARIRRERAGGGTAIVSVYSVDDEILQRDDLHIMAYNGATVEWLDFVVANRRNAPLHNYDIVLGPVANDKVFTTVNLFESGVLSVEAAIMQLKAYKTYDQLSFHTDKVIKTLNFLESIEV